MGKRVPQSRLEVSGFKCEHVRRRANVHRAMSGNSVRARANRGLVDRVLEKLSTVVLLLGRHVMRRWLVRWLYYDTRAARLSLRRRDCGSARERVRWFGFVCGAVVGDADVHFTFADVVATTRARLRRLSNADGVRASRRHAAFLDACSVDDAADDAAVDAVERADSNYFNAAVYIDADALPVALLECSRIVM